LLGESSVMWQNLDSIGFSNYHLDYGYIKLAAMDQLARGTNGAIKY